MLPAASRLRRSAHFQAVTRRGTRVKSGVVVIHLLQEDPSQGGASAQVGVVASKAVGNAVQRHRAARRLRHAMRPHLARLSPNTKVVIRALPGAAELSWETLVADLEVALRRAGLKDS